MKWVISVFAVMFSGLVVAENAKSNEPGGLGLFIYVQDTCTFSGDVLRDKIEGEFLRARIKPTENLDFYLNIEVLCMDITSVSGNKTGHAVSYGMRFGEKSTDGEFVLLEQPNFGSMLIAGPNASSSQFLVNAINDSASSALTELLRQTM